MSGGKWVPMTPLQWARNTSVRKTFPSYREYYFWAEEMIENLEMCKKLLEERKKNE